MLVSRTVMWGRQYQRRAHMRRASGNGGSSDQAPTTMSG